MDTRELNYDKELSRSIANSLDKLIFSTRYAAALPEDRRKRVFEDAILSSAATLICPDLVSRILESASKLPRPTIPD